MTLPTRCGGQFVTGGRHDIQPYWDWRRGRYVTTADNHLDPRIEANRIRWRRAITVGDRSSMTTTVSHAYDRSFRLVDSHGRVFGQRYVRTGMHRESQMLYAHWEYLARDARGKETWIDGGVRVRIVDAQPEDLHSQFSRMLKAAHKKGLE